MLKWTVNAKRSDLAMGENPFEANLNVNNNNTNMRDLPPHRTRRSLGVYPRLSVGKENLVNCKSNASPRTPLSRQHRRQSLGVLLSQSKKSRVSSYEADKENNNNNINSFVLSPPLKANIYGAFRDVSNITPTSTPTSNTVSSQRRKRSLSQLQASNTPAAALLTDVAHLAHPAQYASTLPTFDIEYSPFGLRHKPFLDTYFNQPRYITPQVVPRTAEQPPPEEEDEEEDIAPASKKPKIAHSQKAKSPSEPPMTPLSHRLNEVAMCDSTPAKMSSNQKRPRKFFFMNHNNNSITKLNDDDESPTSADVGDLTLDHMIDAILESARKEPTRKITSRRRFSCNFKLDKPKQLEELKSHFGRVKEPSTFESPTYTAADDPASDLQEEFLRCSPSYLSAIVEQEQQQHRQQMETMERTMIEEEQTVMFNEREVKTPDSVVKRQAGGSGVTETRTTDTVGEGVENKEVVATKDEDCALRRQNALRRKTAKNFKPIGLTLPNGIPSPGTPATVRRILDEMDTPYNMELADMDTPKVPIRIEEKTSTDSDSHLIFDDFTPGMKSNELRASSTPTISTSCGNLSEGTRRYLQFSPEFEDLTNIERRRSVASSTNSRYGKNVVVSGSLDLAILTEGNKLIVHVIRCRDLQRPNGSSINAYVKVALLPMENVINNPMAGISTSEAGFQRTAVHRDSSRPYFDHRFIFELNDENDTLKRIQLTVWHRDRTVKRSDFLGCLWFPVKNVLKKEFNGSFKLQNQLCLTSAPPIMCENSQSSVDEVVSLVADDQSMDKHAIAFSKKALHQQDADENLFLRFLELDPVESPPSSAAALQGTPSSQRRQSSIKNVLINSPPPQQVQVAAQPSPATTAIRNSLGRTPFTVTKRLQRHHEKGYGFSIVWTHPPRVEKVEASLPADRAGILPGDFVIFVDKHNVVTMPELDILNLIRSQGATMTLEIFRRPAGQQQPQQQTTSRPLRMSSIESERRERYPSTSSNTNQEGNFAGVPGGLNGGTTATTTNNNNVTSSSCSSVRVNNEPGSAVNSVASNFVVNASNGDTENNNNNNNNINNNNSSSNSANVRPLQNSSGVLNLGARSSIGCSNASMETTKRRLHLPQVTFSKESILPLSNEDQKMRYLYQLINREHHFVTALSFGQQRFVSPLQELKDLISHSDHKTLFQNLDELQRISEDILEQLVLDNNEVVPLPFASRVYSSKTTAICVAYKKYCNGLKRADCVLVNKSRCPNSDFMKFITEPQVPRKRPDLTTLIHRPLQHFREILKLMQLMTSNCRIDTEEYRNFAIVVNELQAAYREITVGGGLMEPIGEGRPLLTLQDLESRLVFTKCKPFILAASGRQWIFGGDLSRVDGRSVKPYWTLLFNDILLFAKVSRDRVLFITEEPVPLIHISESMFNVRKKSTEFRLTIDPNGKSAESPTTHCTPELTRTPKRNSRRSTIILRAPSMELKAVWQNLLQRQILLVNSAFGHTPLSSPLESPDVMQLLLPMTGMGATNTSMASIKLSSADSLPVVAAKSSASSILNQTRSQVRAPPPAATTATNPLPVTRHIEDIIDEKCRILNKNGTPKGGALHLAQWMKGQFDSQQQKHKNLMNALHSGRDATGAAATTNEQTETGSESFRSDTLGSQAETHMDMESDHEPDKDIDEERIEDWTVEQVRKRSRELKLIDSSGHQVAFTASSSLSSPSQATPNQEDLMTEDGEEEEHRSKSPSRSTTSDSQITVRSSPIITASNVVDAVPVCRQCHKGNCHKTGSINHKDGKSMISKMGHHYTRCCQSTGYSNSSTSTTNKHNKSSSFNDSAVISASDIRMSPKSATTKDSNSAAHYNRRTDSPMYLQLNGSCTTIASSVITTTTPSILSSQSPRRLTNNNNSNNKKGHSIAYCQCRCSPRDFIRTTAAAAEAIKQETCKLIENVHEVQRVHETSYVRSVILPAEIKFPCSCETTTTTITTTAVLDPFDDGAASAVPSIAIVPPTPEGKLQSLDSKDSPDSNESGQCEDPPYTVFMSNSLRRYGTMSSLEKVPSDERYDSSDEEEEEEEQKTEKQRVEGDFQSHDSIDDDGDIQVITKKVYKTDEEMEANASLRNWTARAGSYMADKISFFEESRAFFDKYMGRWERDAQQLVTSAEEAAAAAAAACEGSGGLAEECTSGATSGEDVWGTPSSGGENDEMQMFNSDQTQSSPTSSSFGDDDTELMMDELLMAPPMTASAVRGLLPRRRLEPLFEEDTESGESDDERTAALKYTSSSSNQGQVSERGWAIGRRLDSRGSLVPLPTTAISSPPRELLLEKQAAAATASPRAHPVSPPQPQLPPPPPPRTRTRPPTVQSPAAATATQVIAVTITDRPDSSRSTPSIDIALSDVDPALDEDSGRAADSGGVVGAVSPHGIAIASGTMRDRVQQQQHQRQESDAGGGANYSVAACSGAGIIGMSPRMEMRLALNRDIMNDEDLINYGNGLDLATILGHDLSSYRKQTAHEMLNRSPPQRFTGTTTMIPRAAVASSSTSPQQQENNSKMDTPTPSRRKASPSTWSSFAYVERTDGVGESKSSNSNERNLGDLERLARQEKMYSLTHLRNAGPRAVRTEEDFPRQALTSTHSTPKRRTRTLLNFLTRRNSENHLLKIFPKELSDENLSVSSNSYSTSSSQRDPEKALERRFWKQLGRRRSISASEISTKD